MLTFLLLLLLLLGAFVWWQMPLKTWLLTALGVFFVALVTGVANTALCVLLLLLLLPMTVLLYFAPWLRTKYLTAPLFALVKRSLPPVSRTEQEAIDAGTVWWDAQLFAGQPQWEKLFKVARPKLSAAEQAFIDGPVEQVCSLADDWQITHTLNDLPPNIWQFLKQHKFFGLNAPQAYGGLEFSAYAQSCIVEKLASRSGTLAVTVMVPNSLGPAELLHHYGSAEQKQYYLPRLVTGEEVPCFGLTNPWAGSDASGMPDHGVACEGMYDGESVLGFRVNWQKRYITLGPVASLLGLAFKAYDPQKLLGDVYDLGITCALVPTDTAGVSIGTRHLPLNAAFQNGPNSGQDVFIPMQWVIGGQQQVGQGWRMLMESLAAGRGISLPAAAAGAAKLAARSSGAYAQIREQFGIEIGKFEGVEEVLARIGGLTYLLDAGRTLMTSALALGEKPAVMSAIVKQQCTELSRQVVNDAMDLHGGKGICLGPANYLARAYQQIPIGITVEGANILTRSLIIFGQGALRCHPYLLQEMQAVTAQAQQDSPAAEQTALALFDQLLDSHIEYTAGNKIRALVYGLSRGYLARGSGQGVIKRYTRRIEHLSAAFAYLADVTLLLLGGELKRREMLSARFADVLSNLYLATASLKRFADHGQAENEQPLVDWACQYALFQAQQALDGILRNYPIAWLGRVLRVVVFPSGRYLRPPSDALNRQVAALLQTPGAVRDRLTAGIYLATDTAHEITAQLEAALLLMQESKPLRRRLKQHQFEQSAAQDYDEWLNTLLNAAHVTKPEADLLKRTRDLVAKVIAVDDFASAAAEGLAEELPEVAAVAVPDELPEVGAVAAPDEFPEVAPVAAPDELPEVAAVAVPDELPEVGAVAAPDELPEVGAVAAPDEFPDVGAVAAPDELPEVAAVAAPDELPAAAPGPEKDPDREIAAVPRPPDAMRVPTDDHTSDETDVLRPPDTPPDLPPPA